MKITTGTTLGEIGELCLERGDQAVLSQLQGEAYLVVFPWNDSGNSLFDTCMMSEDEETHDPANATVLDHDGKKDVASRVRRAHAAAQSLNGTEAFLVPVVKTSRNPFSQLITLGRAGNNDLIVNSPSVSKVHAWFLNGGPTGWFIQDNGSTNGTNHNDEPAAPRTNLAIRFGDTVGFGGVQAVFTNGSGVLELAKRRW